MQVQTEQNKPSIPGTVVKIFISALVIRWIYAAAIFLVMGDAGLMTSDLVGYLGFAQDLANSVTSRTTHGWDWMGPSPHVMPLFTWILTPHVLLFGSFAPFAYVLTQGVIDAATCVIVYLLAATVDRNVALPAAIAATINPTQIVVSGILYTDTSFLFFVSLFLYGSARWLSRPSWSAAIIIGFGMGGAVAIRVLIVPWAIVLPIFLFAVMAVKRQLRSTHIKQLLVISLIFGGFTAPILTRNVMQYGSWSLTAQAGMHLNWFVVPLVKEARDGTPWANGFEEMERRTRERYGPRAENPFEESRRLTEVAVEELKNIAFVDIAKVWIYGAAINLASPAIILSPPIATLPRTGFFATAGASIFDKIVTFVFRPDNAIYGWCLIFGILGLFVLRIFQLIGFFKIIQQRNNIPIVIIFVGWSLFILVVNGPIASPKYRLPIEPVFAVFAGAGIVAVRSRAKK